VVIYPNDHRPAHVHVIGSDGEAVSFLNCDGEGVMLRENYGFALRAINRIEMALNALRGELCRSRETIHGKP
jgi:hypothetical protein